MDEIEKLKEEVDLIKERNRRVELDKKWETSFTRRGLLILFTYLAIGFYLRAINIPRPWLNAIVPAVAFLLSTLTMPFFKKIWEKSAGTIQSKETLIDRQAREKEENKKSILILLETQTPLTNNHIEQLLGISDATATRYLEELEKEGRVRQVGKTGRSVYYEKV